MTVLPDLSEALVRAAERRLEASAESARRRRGRWGRRRFGLLGFGGALVSGTALATTGVWSPQLGDDRRPNPVVSATAVPVDQAAGLAVLRRPQNAADRGARARYALSFLDRRFVDGVRTDAVRVLSTADRGTC